MKDVMLDFEALGNGKDKCLCQVGAIYFDRVTGENGPSYKATIDAESHAKVGGKLDASTVYWWLAQSDEARKSILVEDKKSIQTAMMELNEFLRGADRIWSHATFDFVTLMDTLKQLDIKPSFGYKAGLDIRTLVYLSGASISDVPREGTHHDALDDCKHQIKYCVIAMTAVKGNKQALNLLNKLLK